VFKRLRRKPSGKHVFLYAFDLLELDGQDLRREPLETRKATLASLLRGSLPGLRLNEHLAHDGESVFRHACKMGPQEIRGELPKAETIIQDEADYWWHLVMKLSGSVGKINNEPDRAFLRQMVNELSVAADAVPTKAQQRWLLSIEQELNHRKRP
jgi:hypothetical protein